MTTPTVAENAKAAVAPAHPWKRTARTLFVLVPALAAMLPGLVNESGLDATLPWLAGLLGMTAGLTRLLASPTAEVLLRRFAPWLAASDVAANRVVAQVVEVPDSTPVVVAGEAHPAATGTSLNMPAKAPPKRRRRKDAGQVDLTLVVALAIVVLLVLLIADRL